MLNTCPEQIGCAQPIDLRGGIQLEGKFTADSAGALLYNRGKETEINVI